MMQDSSLSSEGFDRQEWLEGLDLDQPLWELIDDPAWLEGVTFEPDELTHLEELGREYAQELLERDALPDTPLMDMPEAFFEPEHAPEQAHDLDFDR
jgi:hypothetical protein